jgi:hypothetical protein
VCRVCNVYPSELAESDPSVLPSSELKKESWAHGTVRAPERHGLRVEGAAGHG